MKIFFYKTLFVSLIFVIVYKITIGSMINKIQNKAVNYFSKENIEFLKIKIREEISHSLEKERIISEEDKILINKFFNKIKKDLN